MQCNNSIYKVKLPDGYAWDNNFQRMCFLFLEGIEEKYSFLVVA